MIIKVYSSFFFKGEFTVMLLVWSGLCFLFTSFGQITDKIIVNNQV